jgi:hypothetical protein
MDGLGNRSSIHLRYRGALEAQRRKADAGRDRYFAADTATLQAEPATHFQPHFQPRNAFPQNWESLTSRASYLGMARNLLARCQHNHVMKADKNSRVKARPGRKPLTFGDFVAGVYQTYGKRKARGMVQLAVAVHLVEFRRNYL